MFFVTVAAYFGGNAPRVAGSFLSLFVSDALDVEGTGGGVKTLAVEGTGGGVKTARFVKTLLKLRFRYWLHVSSQ